MRTARHPYVRKKYTDSQELLHDISNGKVFVFPPLKGNPLIGVLTIILSSLILYFFCTTPITITVFGPLAVVFPLMGIGLGSACFFSVR